jgi:cyclophilin family peptidyl-prolyl cis-trans isomerase
VKGAATVTSPAPKQWNIPPAMTVDQKAAYTATIATSKGVMKAELFVSEAPATVNNFVFLAGEQFYNGVKFHRIIKDFMVQTGDPRGNGTGGPGYQFKDEPVKRKYVKGTLAMANAGPNINGSQFFIVHKDYPLPPNYTIFGQITEGMDVLDAIASTPVGPNIYGEPSQPKEAITITSVSVAKK